MELLSVGQWYGKQKKEEEEKRDMHSKGGQKKDVQNATANTGEFGISNFAAHISKEKEKEMGREEKRRTAVGRKKKGGRR